MRGRNAVIEIVVVLTIIATALLGSQAMSERAFPSCWFGNRPEPLSPLHGFHRRWSR
jgi:hypothetical protein